MDSETFTLVAEPEPTATPEPAPAAEPGLPRAELTTGYMVIVAGSTTEAEGKAELEAKKAAGLPQEDAWPKLIDSSTIEGLKPGFFIVVIAVPEEEDDAKTIRDSLLPRFEGVYYRKVQVTTEHADSVRCDDSENDLRCAGVPGWRAIIVFDYTDGMESEDWAFFTDEVIRAGKAVGIDAKWDDSEEYVVDVHVDGKKVGEVDLEPFLGEMFGYVFAKEGAPPQYSPHDMTHSVIDEASSYFGIEIPNG